jgi:hypothetical protein
VVALLGLVVVTALAGCSAPNTAPSRDASSRKFAGCARVACDGVLDNGDKYRIKLPRVWNGTLLLYSHGDRAADPMPPSYKPASTAADVAPDDEVAQQLLESGYALVGYGQPHNGWTLRDSLDAADRLYSLFRSEVGVPARVYAWGESIGGLVSELLAEQRPWVSGAAPFCGLLAGTNPNQDLALDAAFGVRALLYPKEKLTGYASPAAARATYEEAARRVRAAAKAGGSQLARVLMVGALIEAAEQSAGHDGTTPASRVAAVVENLLDALAFGIIGRPDLEQRSGGNPSTNIVADYNARVPDLKRAEIARLSGASISTVDALLFRVDETHRVEADPVARAAVDRLGNPTGELRVPTVTLHTTVDPLAVPQNERVFSDLVTRASTRTSDLLQLFTRPPARFAGAAPYGAAHCDFTTWEQTGAIIALDRWVKTGNQPTVQDLAAMLAGPDRKTGFIPLFQPAPWPPLAGS